VAGLLSAGEIANDQGRTAVDQVRQRSRAVGVAGVNDDLVAVGEQGGGGGGPTVAGAAVTLDRCLVSEPDVRAGPDARSHRPP